MNFATRQLPAYDAWARKGLGADCTQSASALSDGIPTKGGEPGGHVT